MRVRLTNRSLEAASPSAKRQILWDTTLAGFGLKVEPSGRKVFILQYRLPGRTTRRFRIGAYGDLTLEQARRIAGQLRADIAQRIDPASQRSAMRTAPTMADLADRYLREHAEVKKKPSSCATDRHIWRAHVLPRLRNLRVSEVTRNDLAQLHFAMRATPYQANRTLAVLSKAFALADRWGWCTPGINPARGIDRFREHRRDRLLRSEELERLGQALCAAESADTTSAWAVAAIRLLLLTGCRKSEILGLRWFEVDLERRVLRLSDSKTGQRLVPLSEPAARILRDLPRVEDNPYVVVGLSPGKSLNGLHRIWARIRRDAQLGDLRLHDLRHHFASLGAAAGLSLPTLGAILGHRTPATTARYIHWQNESLLAAVNLVGGKIERAIAPPVIAPVFIDELVAIN